MITMSMRGQKIDIARLQAQNPEKMALSGLPKGRDGKQLFPSMNARGDIIGRNGSIAIPREQVAREYHKVNPKAVKQIALRDIKQEVFASDTPAQAVAKHKEAQRKVRKMEDRS